MYERFERDASGEYVVPGLEADQRILDATLVVLGHVLMHVRVVLPDVAFGAAVRDRPEAEGRGIGVGTLELHSKAQKKESHRWILRTLCRSQHYLEVLKKRSVATFFMVTRVKAGVLKRDRVRHMEKMLVDNSLLFFSFLHNHIIIMSSRKIGNF